MSATLPSQLPESSFPLPTLRVVGILWHTLYQSLCLVSYGWHYLSNPQLFVSFLTRTRANEFIPHPHLMCPRFNLTDHIGKDSFQLKLTLSFAVDTKLEGRPLTPKIHHSSPNVRLFFIFSPLESVTHSYPSAQGSTYTADCS